jgi:transposase
MLNTQAKISFSEYAVLYDLLIPQDHKFRRFLSLVDFSFVYDELKSKYCPDNGRTAIDPVMMFKYLVLKAMSNLSDEKLVERCKYDLSYKFFLGLMPEDNVIESSTLSRFRRQRLADADILDLLLGKTVSIAKEHKLIDGKTIIVDSTHTLSKCVPLNQVEILQKDSKALRKMIYGVDEKLKESMPQKYEGNSLKKELDYIKELVKFVSAQPRLAVQENISEGASLLKEKVEDIEDHYTLSNDPEARIGHKSADSEFYGYKTHLAMTPERVIVAATLTTGEKGDGPELPELIDKSKETLPDLERVVGDAAYAGQKNLEKAEHDEITIVAKVNPMLLEGTDYEKQGFSYNKDADRVVCPAGHMSIHAKRIEDKTGNDRMSYRFSRKVCTVCGRREMCIRGNSTSPKKISYPIKTPQQKKQIEFMKTEEFQQWYKERYKIEAKNSDLKKNYGYDKALYYGICGMKLQGAVALFACNLNQILRLMDQKAGK